MSLPTKINHIIKLFFSKLKVLLVFIVVGYGIFYFMFRVDFHGRVVDTQCTPLNEVSVEIKYQSWDAILRGFAWKSPWRREIIQTDRNGNFNINMWASHFYIEKVNHSNRRYTFPNLGKYNPNKTQMEKATRLSDNSIYRTSKFHRNDKDNPIIFWGYNTQINYINYRSIGIKKIGASSHAITQPYAGIIQNYNAIQRDGIGFYFDFERNVLSINGNFKEINEQENVFKRKGELFERSKSIQIKLKNKLSRVPQAINRSFVFSSDNKREYGYGYIKIRDISLDDDKQDTSNQKGYLLTIDYDLVNFDNKYAFTSKPLLVIPVCKQDYFTWLGEKASNEIKATHNN